MDGGLPTVPSTDSIGTASQNLRGHSDDVFYVTTGMPSAEECLCMIIFFCFLLQQLHT